MRGRPNEIPTPIDVAESDEWERRLRVEGLDALGDRREHAIREYRRLLDHLRDHADRSDADADRYLTAVDGVSVDELTHHDVMKLARDLDAPITPADSLFLDIAIRRRLKQLGPVPENHLGITKQWDQVFARALELRTAQVRYRGLLADVPENVRTNTVLKPERAADSRGVFYLFDTDRIRSVQHGITLASWSDMVDAVEKELGSSFVEEESWQVQELIVEDTESTPARDLKFYAFYGEIGLIVEATRHTRSQYEYFDPDGTVADCGREFEPRFDDPSLTITDKGGVPASYLEEVGHLSRQIPVPFMRIDYLNGIDGLVFNEMSSAPARSHSWSATYDRRMGKLYHEAQIRLLNDLLDGKEFARYKRFRLLQRAAQRSGAPSPTAESPLLDAGTNSLRRGRPNEAITVRADDAERWDRKLATSSLDAILEDREWSLRQHRLMLEHLRRRAGESDRDAELYLRAINASSIDELTHLDLVTVGRTMKADLDAADSFFRAIVVRRRKKQLGPVPERYLGISKEFDQLFAAELGIRRPEVLFTGPLSDVPAHVRVNTMIKPIKSSGSKGAFYLFDTDRIRSIQNSVTLSSWSAMIESIEATLGPEYLRDQAWQVQELVYEGADAPARDLKFYAFYGEIGLIQEVSRHESPRYQYFDADGTIADCGRTHEPRFADDAATITNRGGVPDHRLDEVRALSREIPAPFMRIDYLNGNDGLVFLEMSSAPGMAHTLSDDYDRRLGRMYSAAEVRLTNDLLDGKQFDGYHRFVDMHRRARSGDAPSPQAASRSVLADRVPALRRFRRR